MLLDKFKVTNEARDFALYVVRDNGECRRLQDTDCPLITRVILGPNEEASKVFILNDHLKEISPEVAQYLNLSPVELNMFLRKFEEEELKEIKRIKNKYDGALRYMKARIKELESSA